MTNMVKHIVVLGNSISAWLSAAALSRATKHHGVAISLCTLGEPVDNLGNASIRPEFDGVLHLLGISEAEFMQHSQASFKLANHFKDWNVNSDNFFHAFGEYGTTVANMKFPQFFARLQAEANVKAADVYSLGAQLAKHNKFSHPNNDPQSILSTLFYGWNIDADAYRLTLKQQCIEQNITVIDAALQTVETDSNHKLVTGLQLDNENLLNAELFIDCSCDSQMMMALNNDWENWQSQLPDCEVVSVNLKAKADHQTSNLIQATDDGWLQEIPSQQKLTRHYYGAKNSDWINKIPAEEVLSKRTESQSFGVRSQPWLGNCIAIGRGALTLPSICFSELDLTWMGLEVFIKRLPAKPLSKTLIQEYNSVMLQRYNRAKDVTAMHFSIATPRVSNFWQQVTKSKQSKDLLYKLDLYKNRGKLPLLANDIMPLGEQYALLMGLTEPPKQLDLTAQQVPQEQVQNISLKMERVIQQACSAAATHSDYLQSYCYRRDKSGV